MAYELFLGKKQISYFFHQFLGFGEKKKTRFWDLNEWMTNFHAAGKKIRYLRSLFKFFSTFALRHIFIQHSIVTGDRKVCSKVLWMHPTRLWDVPGIFNLCLVACHINRGDKQAMSRLLNFRTSGSQARQKYGFRMEKIDPPGTKNLVSGLSVVILCFICFFYKTFL